MSCSCASNTDNTLAITSSWRLRHITVVKKGLVRTHPCTSMDVKGPHDFDPNVLHVHSPSHFTIVPLRNLYLLSSGSMAVEMGQVSYEPTHTPIHAPECRYLYTFSSTQRQSRPHTLITLCNTATVRGLHLSSSKSTVVDMELKRAKVGKEQQSPALSSVLDEVSAISKSSQALQ